MPFGLSASSKFYDSQSLLFSADSATHRNSCVRLFSNISKNEDILEEFLFWRRKKNTTMEWLNSILTYFSIVLLISVFLSQISDRWDYRVKMFYIYLWFFLAGIPVIPYGLIVRNPMKTCLCYIACFKPIENFLKLKWKVVGQENIDTTRSYVVLCNHQSVLDAMAAGTVSVFLKFTI